MVYDTRRRTLAQVVDCVRACAEDAACIALDAVVTQRRLSACMLYLGRPEIIDLVRSA